LDAPLRIFRPAGGRKMQAWAARVRAGGLAVRCAIAYE